MLFAEFSTSDAHYFRYVWIRITRFRLIHGIWCQWIFEQFWFGRHWWIQKFWNWERNFAHTVRLLLSFSIEDVTEFIQIVIEKYWVQLVVWKCLIADFHPVIRNVLLHQLASKSIVKVTIRKWQLHDRISNLLPKSMVHTKWQQFKRGCSNLVTKVVYMTRWEMKFMNFYWSKMV